MLLRGYDTGMSHPKPSRSVAIAACILAPCTAACPIPIPHTDTLSAPVSGVLRRSDGTPVRGVEVAVSPDYSDSTCARAIVRTTSDSAGGFRLPAAQKRYRVMWLVPMESFFRAYSLCVAASDTLRTAYHGYLKLPAKNPPPDSLSCLEWAWAGRTRVTCSGAAQTALVSRGGWTAGDASGWYRIISILEDGRRDDRPRVFVQWVARSGTSPRDTVVAMAELPLGKALYRANVAVEEGAGQWCANVVATRKVLMGFKDASFRFALGQPGETRLVRAC